MSSFKDLTGKRFGRLVAISPTRREEEKHIHWICKCDCGNMTTVRSSNLDQKRTKSCGCIQKEAMRRAKTTHGLHKTKENRMWRAMIQRCENPNHTRYADWGGRGISVCREWRESFEEYYKHVTSLEGYDIPKLTLDRIDNDGNYEPGNMRWTTRSQQQLNRRNGKNKCVPT